MDQMVNYILLILKLVCMLSIYRMCNSTVGSLKYESNNKLLGGVMLHRVIPNVIWTQPQGWSQGGERGQLPSPTPLKNALILAMWCVFK